MKAKRAGVTLVELTVTVTVGFIILIAISMLLYVNQQSMQDGFDSVGYQSDASLAVQCATRFIRDATQVFEVYSSYASYDGGGAPVSDGSTGTCLLLPEPDGGTATVLYLDGTAIAKEDDGNPGTKVTLVDNGVGTLTFAAAVDGARTGAVVIDVNCGSGDEAVQMTSQVLPRNL